MWATHWWPTSRTSSPGPPAPPTARPLYLEGVIEFYKARTDTKVTIAAERLALIAVLTLPITAVSSI
jgi:hypothetical protein